MASWRVLTWNVHGSADPELSLIAAALTDQSPDVAALQEIRRSQARRLARQTGWHHVWARKHHPYSPLVFWRSEGLSIMSPHPLTHIVHTSISPGVSTWTYRHRIVLAATVTRGTAALRVFDTHLASDDADQRISQARLVAEMVEADDAPIAVVAGDLNAPGEVEVIREFTRVGLADPGGDDTNPSIAPTQRLDYVLVRSGVQVIAVETPPGDDRWHALSDHLPVVVDFVAAVPQIRSQ